MNLLYDRRRSHRHTVSFGSDSNVGSNSERAELPVGRYSEPELLENLSSYRWLFAQTGEALYGYVQPNRSTKRPKVMHALFLRLCWYHEACRESLDQIATTKFAASKIGRAHVRTPATNACPACLHLLDKKKK